MRTRHACVRSASQAPCLSAIKAPAHDAGSGYAYKKLEPRQGYLQPYGDYFELDIDERGRTQAIWGEAPSYFGPGNVWYSRVSAR